MGRYRMVAAVTRMAVAEAPREVVALAAVLVLVTARVRGGYRKVVSDGSLMLGVRARLSTTAAQLCRLLGKEEASRMRPRADQNREHVPRAQDRYQARQHPDHHHQHHHNRLQHLHHSKLDPNQSPNLTHEWAARFDPHSRNPPICPSKVYTGVSRVVMTCIRGMIRTCLDAEFEVAFDIAEGSVVQLSFAL